MGIEGRLRYRRGESDVSRERGGGDADWVVG
jgi:hypothetical protein